MLDYTELPGKYLSILNISRKGRVALMYLGSQSEETYLCIREQSLSRGGSQSAVRCRWRSLCTLWPSHSQWPSEQISFITTMFLPLLQLSFKLHLPPRKASYPTGLSAPLQFRFGSPRLAAFPKAEIAVEKEEIHTLTIIMLRPVYTGPPCWSTRLNQWNWIQRLNDTVYTVPQKWTRQSIPKWRQMNLCGKVLL